MDFSRARSHLESGGYTLVLDDGNSLLTSRARGVAPLIAFLEDGGDFSAFCAVDKVVGKAAAFLYILLGIRAVFAITVSEEALALLRGNGIVAEYETCVPRIRNRDGTGFCPMESAVLEEKDPHSAFEKIIKTRDALLGK
jgi:hypothetical protein